MQHGTGREYITDLVENAVEVLTDIYLRRGFGPGLAEVKTALLTALRTLEEAEDLDEPGVYGPDYGGLTTLDGKGERDKADNEARVFTEGPF